MLDPTRHRFIPSFQDLVSAIAGLVGRHSSEDRARMSVIDRTRQSVWVVEDDTAIPVALAELLECAE